MRKLDIKDIEDIALGAALLGAGGGGDPYIGKLIAMGAIREKGPATLIDPEELKDEDQVVAIAMMGAPTVLAEKAIGGNEYRALLEVMTQFLGRPVDAIFPIEAGGVNSMLPIAAGARMGIPVVDADGMGRAFPELQMVTFTIGGIDSCPMVLTDEKGNTVLYQTISNQWTENLARAVTMSCGGSVSVALYPMSGKELKAYGVRNILTRSQRLGEAIRNVKEHEADISSEEHFLQMAEGYKLFQGKITDVLRETRGAFNFGRVWLEGIGGYKGKSAYVDFQNENLLACVEGEILATVPDLVCLVDAETFSPVTTDALKYGKRVAVIALPCFELWRSEAGLALTGPRYFGCDTDYIPVEIRCKGGNAHV